MLFNLKSQQLVRKLLLGSVLAGLPVFSATAAFAQDQAAVAKDGTAADGSIVVTAQRREQQLQDVSLSISAVGGEELTQRGVTDAINLNDIVPGLKIAFLGNQVQTYVRGVGDTTSNPYTQASVSLNVDGVYIARSPAFRTNFFDLARVEVLRGPQGTFYGRNSAGGAINIISKDPRIGKTDGYASVEAGNFSLVKLESAASVTLSDQLAVRIAGQLVDSDGNTTSGANDLVSKAARLKILWKPSAAFTMKTVLDYSKVGGVGPGRVNYPAQFGYPWESPNDPRLTQALYPNITLQFDKPSLDNENYGISTEMAYDFGGAVLTVIPAYRYSASLAMTDNGTGTISNETSDQYSLEARVGGESNFGSWVVGAYGFREDQTIDLLVRSVNKFTGNTAATPRYQRQINPNFDTKAWAVFGETTVNVADDLRLIVGGRYTEETRFKEGTIFNGSVANFVPTFDPALTQTFKATLKVDAITWRLGVEYDLSPDNLLYASVNRGFKSGGFTATNDSPFFPEYLTAYTIGSKNNFGAVLLNLEAFYWKYKDQQISFLSLDQGASTFVTRNAGKSTIWGLSVEGVVPVGEHGKLSVSGEYLNATFDQYVYGTTGAAVAAGTVRSDGCLSGGTVGGLQIVDCSGKPLPQSPEWSGNARYTHEFPLANDGSIEFAGDMKFASRTFLSGGDFASRYFQDDGYVTFDASLAYKSPNGAWTLQGYVRNITNEPIYVQASANRSLPTIAGNAPSAAAIRPPRTYGLSLRHAF
jgi:iron complex outermembrane recepter protein